MDHNTLSTTDRRIAAEERPPMSRHETSIRRLYEAVWNGTDPSVTDTLVHESSTIHDRDLSAELRGPDLYRALASGSREIVPTASFAIEDYRRDGDRVAVRWTMKGTHAASMAGVESSGDRVALSGIEINRFAEGGLAETWVQRDQLGRYEQIGALDEGPGSG